MPELLSTMARRLRSWTEPKNAAPTPAPVAPENSRGFQVFMDNLFVLVVIVAAFIAAGLGVGLRNRWGEEEYMKIFYFEYLGRLSLNSIRLLTMPLLISGVISGSANVGSHFFGKFGVCVVAYVLSTTLIAIVVGAILILSIHPGIVREAPSIRRESSIDPLLELIAQYFPDNLVAACVERVLTKFRTDTYVTMKNDSYFPFSNLTMDDNFTKIDNQTNTTLQAHYYDVTKPYLVTDRGTNVLGILVLSIVFGFALHFIGVEGKPMKDFFRSLNLATAFLLKIAIWFTPLGFIFLIATKFVLTKDLPGALAKLGPYIGIVFGGLAIHSLLILPLMYYIFTRKNPLPFAGNMARALAVAWSSGSSPCALPITIESLIMKNKVNIRITRFFAPVGATLNLDGTALFQTVACIYIAQVNNIHLTVADVIVIGLVSIVASVGSVSLPQASLVTIVTVLAAVGLPTDDVALIVSIDWIIDRFRTSVNVWGDAIGAGILDHYFSHLFPPIPPPKPEVECNTVGTCTVEVDSPTRPNGQTGSYPNSADCYVQLPTVDGMVSSGGLGYYNTSFNYDLDIVSTKL
ncbi:excitatory amino acid transporter 3-like [Physella acuta]|uniref:excitatory amino acid transporter 3-like n=1 Tax=Physella acuta TaxID=109671 RepID=UPI0027DD8916|nr:excitatory amino acid transporter 3-like [Physella acuta]XP_059175708.1 excitatory amino acid transporter 3-like [Physella acuta]XP_059175709.1 excitatory amino acid transporter 3-like [Physella acuta]